MDTTEKHTGTDVRPPSGTGNPQAPGMPQAAERPGSALALLVISLGYLMVIVDSTAVNVALPAIGHGTHGDVTWLQWVVDGYTLSFAGLLLTGGALAERLGAGVPVRLIDERLTTVSATRVLAERGVRGRKQRAVVDQAAAVEILQGWLEARRAAP